MSLIHDVHAALTGPTPSTEAIVALIRNPDVPLTDKTALLRRVVPNASEEQAWDVATGRYTPVDLPDPDDEGAWEDDDGDGETLTGPPVHPLSEDEKVLVERAKRERLNLDDLCRDPWGELWVAGSAPLWACLAPDDEGVA